LKNVSGGRALGAAKEEAAPVISGTLMVGSRDSMPSDGPLCKPDHI
jgi:hypothetical protein